MMLAATTILRSDYCFPPRGILGKTFYTKALEPNAHAICLSYSQS